jgi:hypothetical protein
MLTVDQLMAVIKLDNDLKSMGGVGLREPPMNRMDCMNAITDILEHALISNKSRPLRHVYRPDPGKSDHCHWRGCGKHVHHDIHFRADEELPD